jgi:predicted outer membrane protein
LNDDKRQVSSEFEICCKKSAMSVFDEYQIVLKQACTLDHYRCRIDFGRCKFFRRSNHLDGEAMSNINPVQIQKFLKGVDYPASKAALIENAKNQGADENVCSSLAQLPDEDFKTPADVSQAFGELSHRSDQTQHQTQHQAQHKQPSSSTGSNEFLAQAIQDSHAEIEQCELALERTSNGDIKLFAQRMIDDHSAMGREIEQLCSKKNITLPKDVSSEQRSAMKELLPLSGQAFDRKFMQHNVQDHEKDIKVFKHYAEQEDDPEIKALAANGVTKLTEHLRMAQSISDKL